jgi:hypothetical protein
VAARNRLKIGRRGVFLSYISSLGHTLLDRELYLPRHWLEDRARCEKAGIPNTVTFHTKCELARAMMERVHQAQIPVAWVGASTVYGNNLDLRTWLEDHQYWFVLAVASTEQIGMMTPQGRTHLAVAQAEQQFVSQQWRRFSVKTGTKGPLLFEWACLPILHRRARRRAALLAHSSRPNSANRKDLLSGLWACWHPAGGDGLGGWKQMGY